MIDRAIIDMLTYQSHSLAVVWKEKVRAAPQLKSYNTLSDDTLVEINSDFYISLARWFSKGRDTNALGAFFVSLGKNRQSKGFPISEVLYAMVIAERVVVEGIRSEIPMENSLQMYQAMDAMRRISEFFLLGSFYLTKGFMEETYLHLNAQESLPEEMLKRYFRDDFFFK